MMPDEEVIRQRSHLIWLREGSPDGKALDHWLRAKAELESEYRASFAKAEEWRQVVMPRLPISQPPQITIAGHIPLGSRRPCVSTQGNGGFHLNPNRS